MKHGSVRRPGHAFSASSSRRKGWAFCQGQMMPIAQNVALFQVLGTSYGGNGVSTFALPNLQGSAAVGAGQGPGLSAYALGRYRRPGRRDARSRRRCPAIVTPSTVSTNAATAQSPQGQRARPRGASGGARGGAGSCGSGTRGARADADRRQFLQPEPEQRARPRLRRAAIVARPGGNRPHNNMQPYLALNFCIALQGAMPQRG